MDGTTIRRILAEQAQLAVSVDSLGNDDDLYAAGLTSHATVNVMLALEDELDFQFPEPLLRRSTFQSITALQSAVREATGR
jgi:acyl carrier protein